MNNYWNSVNNYYISVLELFWQLELIKKKNSNHFWKKLQKRLVYAFFMVSSTVSRKFSSRCWAIKCFNNPGANRKKSHLKIWNKCPIFIHIFRRAILNIWSILVKKCFRYFCIVALTASGRRPHLPPPWGGSPAGTVGKWSYFFDLLISSFHCALELP